MDPVADPDLAVFAIDPQDASKKPNFLHNFFSLLLFEGTITLFSMIKIQKESQNSRIPDFLTIFA
jgi:hypothetical protein